MIYRAKPGTVEAISFEQLVQGIREPWISAAIASGDMYWQGGGNPYWTVCTPTGAVQLCPSEWLVRHASGGLYVYTSEEFDSAFERND